MRTYVPHATSCSLEEQQLMGGLGRQLCVSHMDISAHKSEPWALLLLFSSDLVTRALDMPRKQWFMINSLFYLDRLYSIFLPLSEGICRDTVLDNEFSYTLVW